MEKFVFAWEAWGKTEDTSVRTSDVRVEVMKNENYKRKEEKKIDIVHCTYNVTLKRVRATSVAVENNN